MIPSKTKHKQPKNRSFFQMDWLITFSTLRKGGNNYLPAEVLDDNPLFGCCIDVLAKRLRASSYSIRLHCLEGLVRKGAVRCGCFASLT